MLTATKTRHTCMIVRQYVCISSILNGRYVSIPEHQPNVWHGARSVYEPVLFRIWRLRYRLHHEFAIYRHHTTCDLELAL
jgi:hypothetical protein